MTHHSVDCGRVARSRFFEGRRLPKPQEPVVDQGLQFDLVTLFERRHVLRLLGLGLGGSVLAACGSASDRASTSGTTSTSGTSASTAGADGSIVEIPDETAGPYPGDGSNGPDVLQEAGVVRADLRSSFGASTTTARGIVMTLTLTVLDIEAGGAPLVGAAVYVWHCTADGKYSLYSDGVQNENYLRGVQITDGTGAVRFTSVFPGCYSGRWPHVHFEVYPNEQAITDATKVIATSQLALPQTACDAVYATAGYETSAPNLTRLSLTTDNVFGNDAGVHQLGTATGDPTVGYAVALTVPVDTRTAPTGGSIPPGGP